VGAEFGVHATRFEDADAHVSSGDFLTQCLGESVDAELGEVVDAVPVPGHATGDRADVDDVCKAARGFFGGPQQVR
jgi:hypothetical protein